MGKIKTAVITGHHPYDVTHFQAMFRDLPGINFYPQNLEDFVGDKPQIRQEFYDVLVFYNFHQATPGSEANWWEQGMKVALEQLGETQQGIFLLHHAILAFPEWEHWAALGGASNRFHGFDINETVRTDIADPDHPITQGLSPWEMIDETYQMDAPDPDSHILLTTDHPKNGPALAWVRQFKNARVFCYQSGHDHQTYADPNFRTVVSRGIQWCAGKL